MWGIGALELVASGPNASPKRGCLRCVTRRWVLSHADTGGIAEMPNTVFSSAYTCGSSSWLGVSTLSLGR